MWHVPLMPLRHPHSGVELPVLCCGLLTAAETAVDGQGRRETMMENDGNQNQRILLRTESLKKKKKLQSAAKSVPIPEAKLN